MIRLPMAMVNYDDDDDDDDNGYTLLVYIFLQDISM